MTTATEPGSNPRTRTVATLVGVVVALAVATVLIIRPGSGGAGLQVDAAGVPDLIRDSVAALESGDYAAWRSVRSPDAKLSDGHPVTEDSPLRRAIARRGELDLEISVLGCDETTAPSSSTRSFACRIEGSTAILRAADTVGTAQWTYVVAGDRIVESSPPFFDNGADIVLAHGALSNYLRETDRATFQEVCNGNLDFFDPGLGPDCTGFIQQHLEGFAASGSEPS